MGHQIKRIGGLALAMLVLCIFTCAGGAADVTVNYDRGEVEVDQFQTGSQLSSNAVVRCLTAPNEINGMQFTRLQWQTASPVTITAEANAVAYLLLDKMCDGKLNPAVDAVAGRGWKQVGEVIRSGSGNRKPKMVLLRREFATDASVRLDQSPGGMGYMVLASSLTVEHAGAPDTGKESGHSHGTLEGMFDGDDPSAAGRLKTDESPATNVARRQTSIRALQVYTHDSGLMLGEATEVVLTVGRGSTARPIDFHFATPVGYQMKLTRDDALRYIHLTYPTWQADGAELTFEDKYQSHEGGSIGTALAILVRSAIEGFEIDRDVAITGDIGANGRVLRIGGVYAKVHGAELGRCRLMGLPVSNFDELVNTAAFVGKGEMPQVQIVGLVHVDDAIAWVRKDRAPELTEAMRLYDTVLADTKKSPGYLQSQECRDALAKILTLAPNHLSARLLQILAEGKRPKTLSATASIYYTGVAVQAVLPTLNQRAEEKRVTPPSALVAQGLADLDKLRSVCHPSVLPVIDAWERYIRILSSAESGTVSTRNLEAQRQAIVDALADLDTDPELVQKMIMEGI